jgi:uncharacterized membrane protein (UPF0127 family)
VTDRRVVLGAVIAAVLVALVASGAVAVPPAPLVLGSGDASAADGDRLTVTILASDGTRLAAVDARVADDRSERYVGLSTTDALGPDEGMLFVFESEGSRAFVMRNMSFPLDIVFVGADHRITAIREAPVEDPPYRRYRGRAKWVLEVDRGYTDRHGIAVGDRVRIGEMSDAPNPPQSVAKAPSTASRTAAITASRGRAASIRTNRSGASSISRS